MNVWTPDSCRELEAVTGDTLRPGGLELSERLIDFGDFQPGSRILDAGCGMGATSRYLMQTRQLVAVGVDGSPSMLAAARSNSSEVPLVCAALENLPFAAKSFDGVMCECVLSQTAVATVLAEFLRILRPDGVLLVTDLYQRTARHNSGMDCLTDRPTDCPIDRSLATKEQMETMLEQASFKIEQWEDRTRDLQRLAVQLIMAPGSACENLFGWRKNPGFFNNKETGAGYKDLGYYLLVARKAA